EPVRALAGMSGSARRTTARVSLQGRRRADRRPSQGAHRRVPRVQPDPGHAGARHRVRARELRLALAPLTCSAARVAGLATPPLGIAASLTALPVEPEEKTILVGGKCRVVRWLESQDRRRRNEIEGHGVADDEDLASIAGERSSPILGL